MKAFLVAGLGYGDEGKGATVDFLARTHNAGLVVRYNGGSQAGHNVVTPEGIHHTFQQFGSGMFHPSCKTHLSRFMLVNPMNMMREEEHLRVHCRICDAWQRTSVDEAALIITPFHRELNRAMSPEGTNSCGHGVGVCRDLHLTYGDAVLFAGDLLDREKTYAKLRFLQIECLQRAWPRLLKPDSFLRNENAVDICWNWYKDWRNLVQIVKPSELEHLAETECVIFEGAQGVLLDENHGEPGYNTWTDTTFNNANTLLDEAGYSGERIRVGVTRTYHTRHGDGPFPTEDKTLIYPEPHNEDGSYQGQFRRGHFDDSLFCKAVYICGGIDCLATNHLDQHFIEPKDFYKWHCILSFGPTYMHRKERNCHA